MNYNLSKQGYILDHKGDIESITYKEYLSEFGSDQTTTPRGVAPRLYVDGNTIMSWGVRGNNHRFYASFKNKREATDALYEVWEQNVSNDWDAPRFFTTKKELFEDVAERECKDVKVVKRYYRILENRAKRIKQQKQKDKELRESLKVVTKETVLNYIKTNRQIVQTSMNELNSLKMVENKSEWQVKANSLVQKVSNNDFRALTWKEVYNLIKENT